MTLFVVSTLLAAKSAHAHAPMCDPSAATVVAELPAPPAQSGVIEQAPSCPQAAFDFSVIQLPTELPGVEQPKAATAKIAVSPGVVRFGRVASAQLMRSTEIGGFRGGFSSSVYRPPCA